MKHRKTQILNHRIGEGNKEFDRVVAKGTHATIQVLYFGIDTEDVTLSVQQSTGDSSYDVIQGVTKFLQSALTSHTFNIIDLNNDGIRVVLDTGTATTGEIKKISYIFE